MCTVDGQTFNFGDFTDSFSVQSIGKTFAYTLALIERGHELVHSHMGQEPSGKAFNDFTLTKKGVALQSSDERREYNNLFITQSP